VEVGRKVLVVVERDHDHDRVVQEAGERSGALDELPHRLGVTGVRPPQDGARLVHVAKAIGVSARRS